MAHGGGTHTCNGGGPQTRTVTAQETSEDDPILTDTKRFSVLDNTHISQDEARNLYFLAHSDHPNASLVPKIHIGGENYSSWKRSMMVSLLAKNKVKFVNGKLPQPDPDDNDYDAWCQCNSMVISWILHVVSTEIADSIMYLDDDAAIWSELHDRFHQNNGPRVFEVKSSMQVLTQGCNNVQTYFTRLKALWDLVKEFHPQHVCSCGAMKTIVEY
ncbi:uncharacterized protein LOC133823993 [Humulus lupulus]|uniref:uncharacterized protein LOC133823993 n=1 Tax=Humulus lupulus TaxID=3486 RepID=UPI002B410C59|nr:uncharacterized protein LOC133823993 [Humulus lupulus]